MDVGVELQLVVVDQAAQVLPQNALARAREHLHVQQVLQPLLAGQVVQQPDVPDRHAARVQEGAQLRRVRGRVLHRLQLRAHVADHALQLRPQLLRILPEVVVHHLRAYVPREVGGRQHHGVVHQQLLAGEQIVAVIVALPHLVFRRAVETGHAVGELRGRRGLVVDVGVAAHGQRRYDEEAEAAHVHEDVGGHAEPALLLARVCEDVPELCELSGGGFDGSTGQAGAVGPLIIALLDDARVHVVVDEGDRVERLELTPTM